MIVEKDSLLTCVSIKPLVLRFGEDVFKVISGVPRLSNSRGSPNPNPSEIFGLCGLERSKFEGVKGLLKLEVITGWFQSLSNCFLGSHLDDLGVSTGEVSLYISLSGLNSKRPWACQSGLLLVAIVIGSIIKFNKFEMGVFTLGLEKPLALGVLGLDKVLEVNCAVLSFLELACYVDHTRDLTPLL